MLAFDTNYVVRHLMGDEPRQARQVARAIKTEAAAGRLILIPDLVIAETLWVMERLYNAHRPDLLESVLALLDEPAFTFEDRKRIETALARFRDGRADFSDYLIDEIGKAHGCSLQTFDKTLRKEP